ncbi:MAG: hypothetical protein IJW09_01015 [Clostridia bacterium]|nr:hypothetical protein [Clostridia bacterium]
MKDIDRLDEHASQYEPDEREVLQQKQKRRRIKQVLWVVGKNLLYRAATLILFFLFVSRMIETEVYHESGLERNVLIAFSVVFTIIHALITGFELSGDGERRRAFLQMLNTRTFTRLLPLEVAAPDLTLLMICHLAVQLPFALFHHALGFFYPQPTIIEQFYCMDAGWMELTRFGIIGALLHTFVFILIVTVVRYIVYLRWNKEKI